MTSFFNEKWKKSSVGIPAAAVIVPVAVVSLFTVGWFSANLVVMMVSSRNNPAVEGDIISDISKNGEDITPTKSKAKAASDAGSSTAAKPAKSSGKAPPNPATDFGYDLNKAGTGMVIEDYLGTRTTVEIPASIEGYPVVEIGDDAFRGYGAITSIVIPNSVVTIGNSAFRSMSGLTRVTLPDGIKAIRFAAFAICRKLTTINLPASLESIGREAFSDCDSLDNLVIPSTLTRVKFVGGIRWTTPEDNDAFLGCPLTIKTQQTLRGLGYTGEF